MSKEAKVAIIVLSVSYAGSEAFIRQTSAMSPRWQSLFELAKALRCPYLVISYRKREEDEHPFESCCYPAFSEAWLLEIFQSLGVQAARGLSSPAELSFMALPGGCDVMLERLEFLPSRGEIFRMAQNS